MHPNQAAAEPEQKQMWQSKGVHNYERVQFHIAEHQNTYTTGCQWTRLQAPALGHCAVDQVALSERVSSADCQRCGRYCCWVDGCQVLPSSLQREKVCVCVCDRSA